MSPHAIQFRKGLAWLCTGLIVLLTVAFAASEVVLRRPPPPSSSRLQATAGREAVARGASIARIYGCADCHGQALTGRRFHDEPMLVQAFGPNLTRAAMGRSDADLDVAIRQGVGLDGRRMWIMPSSTFARLSDNETADLIAYLRSRPAGGVEQPPSRYGPLARLAVLLGRFRSEPEMIAAQQNQVPMNLGAAHENGRLLARACIECHGATLAGKPLPSAPDLTIAAAYDAQQFRRLLRTGKASDGREMPLMSPAARSRFSTLDDQQIAALHAYLRARAEVIFNGETADATR